MYKRAQILYRHLIGYVHGRASLGWDSAGDCRRPPIASAPRGRAWPPSLEAVALLQGLMALPVEKEEGFAVGSLMVRTGFVPCPAGIKEWHKSAPKKREKPK